MSLSPEKAKSLQENEKLQKPSLYNIFYLNDDYTAFDFVIHTLVEHFNKSYEEAAKLAEDGHDKGKFCAGTFTFEIAETKAALIMHYAKENGFPLKLVLEKNN